ncbi:hypothetical protein FS749_010018, partial [Ceratobasidium sp. UAMH 11750]
MRYVLLQPALGYGLPLPHNEAVLNAPAIDTVLLTQGYSGNELISATNPRFDCEFLDTTVPLSESWHASRDFRSHLIAPNDHPSTEGCEIVPQEYFGILDEPELYAAPSQEELGMAFEELINYSEAGSADDKMAPSSQPSPANPAKGAVNLALESSNQGKDEGAPSPPFHQASSVRYQSSNSVQGPSSNNLTLCQPRTQRTP